MTAILPTCFLGSVVFSFCFINTNDNPLTSKNLIKVGCSGMLACLIVKNGLEMLNIGFGKHFGKSKQLALGTTMNILATIINSEAAPLFTVWTLGWQFGDFFFEKLSYYLPDSKETNNED